MFFSQHTLSRVFKMNCCNQDWSHWSCDGTDLNTSKGNYQTLKSFYLFSLVSYYVYVGLKVIVWCKNVESLLI